MKKTNMFMVMRALRNAGLNDNQARILAAEIGRENAFEDKHLWGYHSDPKNGKVNVGIISWQGERGRGVEAALKNAGLLKNGKITKGQDSLDVMAKYLVNEIQTNPEFSATKKYFLDNPNVDYSTGNKVLGTNFIRWRYNDPKFSAGHRNRDNFYAELSSVGIPKSEDVFFAQVLPNNRSSKSSPLLVYPGYLANPIDMPTNDILGLDLDLFSTLNMFNNGQNTSVSSNNPLSYSMLPDIKL